MNGPQRTACLAKGYIHSKFARCLTAIDSDVQIIWRTTLQTDGRTEWQYAILSLAGSQNLCQTMIYSVTLHLFINLRSTFFVWWHHYDHRTMISILCEYLCQMSNLTVGVINNSTGYIGMMVIMPNKSSSYYLRLMVW